MNTRILMAALLAGVALVAPAQAGNGRNGGGGGSFSAARSGGARFGGGGRPSFSSMPAGRFGGGSFRSMPVRSFSSNRMIYSGQRFSSSGGSQFNRGNVGLNRSIQSGGNSQFARNGNGFARNNRAIQGQRTGGGRVRNGNNVLRSDWRSHVFAQHSANWHRDWDRHHDHFFRGHRFVFFNGFWWGFDLGFYPWWPWWDYPYYGYGYGYPYGYGYYPYGNNYGYGYGYNDSGYYDNQPAYDQSYSGGYDQSANSSVAAAQDKLAQQGFYRGQIDGVLGPETRHAIVRFQSSRGLRVNGELTSETLDAMGLRDYASSGYSNY
jgi:Putative peptidoglycan binding domain